MKLGLERVKAFLETLGEPHRAYPVIHIAGTNGKGSVCAYLTSALVEAGYRVGTLTSPHLEHVNERVAINGIPVDDAIFNEHVEALNRARWDWAKTLSGGSDVSLTYYEFVTTLGFMLFARRAIDVAVVEVGLGGRLDATNVVDPVVTAVTSIGFDHMEQLGDTLASIAGEKAMIIKRGCTAVMGPLPEEAAAVVQHRAERVGAELWRPGIHLRRSERKGVWSFGTPEGAISDVRLQMPGNHQGVNASVAVGVLHQLRRRGFMITDEAVKSGLEKTRLSGRIETLMPGLVIDGAHNPDGARALAAWLQTQPRPRNRILLFGMGSDRDPMEVIAPLLPQVDEVVTTRCAHPKARDPLELARMLEEIDVLLSEGGAIEEALPEVFREADETIVAGSIYLAGAARSIVKSGGLDGMERGQGPTDQGLDQG